MTTPTNATVSSASRVDMTIADNATWADAFQFGSTTDTSWDFTNQYFKLGIKGSREDASEALQITSDASQIIIDDVTGRVLHFNVDSATIQAALPPGDYVYDLIMYDADTPSTRVILMTGNLTVIRGITS